MSRVIYHILLRFAGHKHSLKTQLQFRVMLMFLSFVQLVYNHILNILKGVHFTATLKAYYIILTI